MNIGVVQLGGPTGVINRSVQGVLEEAQQHPSIKKIIGLKNGFEGGGLHPEVEGNLVDLMHTDVREFARPGAILGTSRMYIGSKHPETIEKIKETLSRVGIEALIYIGGNGTAQVMKEMAFPGIQVPKTVDNDFAGDHTPGYASAAAHNNATIRRVVEDHLSFRTKHRVNNRTVYDQVPLVVYQVQGRDTGWLAMATAFAKYDGSIVEKAAPHIILPSELTVDLDVLAGKADDSFRKIGHVFIVCSEELKDQKGNILGSGVTDQSGNQNYAAPNGFSTAKYLSQELMARLGGNGSYKSIKPYVHQLNNIPRTISTPLDSEEARECGRLAVQALLAGNNDHAIILRREGTAYNIIPTVVERATVADVTHRVDEKYLGDGGPITLPSEQFIKDFAPLMHLETLPPIYRDPEKVLVPYKF